MREPVLRRPACAPDRCVLDEGPLDGEGDASDIGSAYVEAFRGHSLPRAAIRKF